MEVFLICVIVVLPISIVIAIWGAFDHGYNNRDNNYRVYRENKYDNDYGTIDYLNKKK